MGWYSLSLSPSLAVGLASQIPARQTSEYLPDFKLLKKVAD